MRVLQEMPKKPAIIMGNYMRVLQRMENVNDYLCPICGYCKRCQKNQRLLWGTICEYCNEWRMSTIICALYAGIARNAKCQRLLWDSYIGITRNVKGQRLLWDLYASITINEKFMWLFLDLYAGITY